MKRKKENKNRRKNKEPHHEHPLPGEINAGQKKLNQNAHQQAEEDMADDAELVAGNKNDDLDEGQTAKLGEDHTDLV